MSGLSVLVVGDEPPDRRRRWRSLDKRGVLSHRKRGNKNFLAPNPATAECPSRSRLKGNSIFS
jgi:hypothetical protein